MWPGILFLVKPCRTRAGPSGSASGIGAPGFWLLLKAMKMSQSESSTGSPEPSLGSALLILGGRLVETVLVTLAWVSGRLAIQNDWQLWEVLDHRQIPCLTDIVSATDYFVNSGVPFVLDRCSPCRVATSEQSHSDQDVVWFDITLAFKLLLSQCSFCSKLI